MILISDKGQQDGKHTEKERYWTELGIEVIEAPLPTGDYILANDKVMDVIFRKEQRGIPVKKMDFLGTYNVTVDTKRIFKSLLEMYAVSNTQDSVMNVSWLRTMALSCMC